MTPIRDCTDAASGRRRPRRRAARASVGSRARRWFASAGASSASSRSADLGALQVPRARRTGFVVGGIAGESGSGVHDPAAHPRPRDAAHLGHGRPARSQPTSGGDTPPLWVSVAARGPRHPRHRRGRLAHRRRRRRGARHGHAALAPARVGPAALDRGQPDVPLIAFAPVVNAIGNQIDRGGAPWPQWLSVAVIASYLAFFPVAVGVLRGLAAPDRIHLDLMRTLRGRLLADALRGCGCRRPCRTCFRRCGSPRRTRCVGAVVAEVSIGMRGGIGRMLIQLAGQASSDPAAPWGPTFGAIALGLVAAGSVALHRPVAAELPPRRGDGMTVHATEPTHRERPRGAGRRRRQDLPDQGRATSIALDRRRPRGRRGRVRVAHRTVRMRQVHAAAPDRRPRPGDQRRRSRSSASPPAARASTRTTASPSSSRGCCRGAPSPRTSRCRSSCTAPARPQRTARVAELAELVGLTEFVGPLPRPALGRHAAARRDRAGARRPGRGCCSWTSRSARSTR